ncbi:DAK2 domain-containing protein [Saccharopolyspora griseoalba]|uniref:DAK2 domain-containing protein n=1 Tax=Saccharopolyspora griseoalba TaxID=1431848 RepID=A0ABW2LGT8_9PSEU
MRTLNAAAARRWADLAMSALAAEREAIDRINVYPVADGDTGTNLLQTMRAAVRSLDEAEPDTLGGVCDALSKGALGGACGNSGMLLSQAIRGVAESLREVVVADGPGLSAALVRAEELARLAVAEPAEGTLLSVLSAAARGSRTGEELGAVVRGAVRAAIDALAATPAQLPALAEAGVVDAGGRGLVVLLDALHAVVCDGEWLAPHGGAPNPEPGEVLEHDSGYDYEVMYLLAGADPERVEALRARLAELGDCVSVVGDGVDSWAVHVHCDDIGGAIEAGIETGRVHKIKVTRFADQQQEHARAVAVLACVPGAELGEVFAAEGADVLVVDEIEVDRLREALETTSAAHVLVLPNDPETAAVVERAVAGSTEGRDVVVVPTASPVQGLAALAVHDPSRRRADDQVAMTEAAAATRRGELRVADAEALTWVGRCRPGDVLGLIDGEVVLIGQDLTAAARDLLTRMLTIGGELLTTLIGQDAPAELPAAIDDHLRRVHPEVEVASYPAGPMPAVLLVGVE